jgi:hypothetical protein
MFEKTAEISHRWIDARSELHIAARVEPHVLRSEWSRRDVRRLDLWRGGDQTQAANQCAGILRPQRQASAEELSQ